MDAHLAMMNNPTALLILISVVVLFVGGNKIPEVMRGVGSGMKEFKKGLNEVSMEEKPPPSRL